MPEDDESQKVSRAPLVIGLVLLGVAAALYIYTRSRPCGCGEKGVVEVAAASADLAANNGHVAVEDNADA